MKRKYLDNNENRFFLFALLEKNMINKNNRTNFVVCANDKKQKPHSNPKESWWECFLDV